MEDQSFHTHHKENHKFIEVPQMKGQTNVSAKRHFSCGTTCEFSKQARHGFEREERSDSTKKLWGAIFLCIIFMVVEIIGGMKANSLAVLTDAAHLLSDVAGFIISLFSVWASSWDPTPRRSFGFSRIEVLGALLSTQIIWLITGILVYKAIDRILHKNTSVNGKLMFIIATFGFFVNLIMALWLDHGHHGHHDEEHKHGHDHNIGHGKDVGHLTEEEKTNLLSDSLKETSQKWEKHDVNSHNYHTELKICCKSDGQSNDSNDLDGCYIINHDTKLFGEAQLCYKNINLQGAYLHVLGDLIQSAGMMIGGAVIWAKPDWLIVDLICTVCFSILVLRTTLSMMRHILDILMESTPWGIDVAMLETGLKNIGGVCAVHELHIWAITVGRTLLSCHVIAEPDADANEILLKIKDYCKEMYKINHITVQIEQE